MGNVCSSSQKKQKDNLSEKSDDSPAYQPAVKEPDTTTDEVKNNKNLTPASVTESETAALPPDINSITQQTEVNKTPSDGDATYKTPQTVEGNDTNVSIPAPKEAYTLQSILQGKPPPGRKIERDKKIVIYLLSDTTSENQTHRRIIFELYKNMFKMCQNKEFELILSDIHDANTLCKREFDQLQEVKYWSTSPLEAQGGHEEAANCLSEISRHLSSAYIIPVLFLGNTLGEPMLPLTIESQDFTSVLSVASDEEKNLLEKWYTIDNSYQPMCHRLFTKDIDKYSTEINNELNKLLGVLLKLFSDDLKDSYLTTVVEQEIHNTVLISQELAKRCIWISSGNQVNRLPDNSKPLENEILRRISKLYTELKNQLSEKNLIRIIPNMNILEEELTAVIENMLEKLVTSIFDEHANKASVPFNTHGVDKSIFEEIQLVGQYSIILAQNSANFDIMNEVKRYIKDSTSYPLFVSGISGCGKSVFVSKIMENIHRWKPEANLILRYSNLTVQSSDLTSMLGSIANQISVLLNKQQCQCDHTNDDYAKLINDMLENSKNFIVLIIDSVDDMLPNGERNWSWLPIKLNNMTKIILTVTDHETETDSIKEEMLQKGIPQKCFIKMRQFTERQWNDILSSGGGDFYAANGALKLPEDWKNLLGKTPYHAKSLWWLAWLGHYSTSINTISDISENMIKVLESKFAFEHVEVLLLILALSQWGICETDFLGIFQKYSKLNAQIVYKIWSKFCWLMGPMLISLKKVMIVDKTFKAAILKRFASKELFVHKTIRDYFDRQDNTYGNTNGRMSYNTQKYLKLPYHHFCAIIENNPTPNKLEMLFNCFYFTDLQWIADKVHSNGPLCLLSDIISSETLAKVINQHCIHIIILKEFLTKHMIQLNYDHGTQFFTLVKHFLKNRVKMEPSLKNDEKICSWIEFTNEMEIPFLEITGSQLGDTDNIDESPKGYDHLVNLPAKGNYVASISTDREEICVWDVKTCERVRTLKGIPQPTLMCPVGTYEAAVLCKREIKVINLDEGRFKVTLKGVMNQKMPYFGLHDQNHLVCLSRNRMYVNLMNLESGDCITTFKAGEDRFLNSLLVSGDGRILVCGDETQKPFPLLVWHLTQRKLLYDLRIPHHDFLTALSAITYEGSYVCVVAKELNEPNPNFIVVYDLQSGTLFKKWKPSCNTVSLAISQANACVIAGLEDAKVLIWDLVTGNCRSTLIGHNAPVTFLKLDPLGKILLSRNKEGEDNSIRLWELNTGNPIAVYKPTKRVTTCEILPNGEFVIAALENCTDLLTLALKNYGENLDENCYTYGNQDNYQNIFTLN